MAGPAIKLHARSHDHSAAGDGTALAPASVLCSGSITLEGNLVLDSDAGTIQLGESNDVVLLRRAADVLAQRRGANAQAHEWYGTYTDDSNYERVSLSWSSGVPILQHQKAGSGANRTLKLNAPSGIVLMSNGFDRWTVADNANFLAMTDGGPDIGQAGSGRPLNIHILGALNLRGTNGQILALAKLTELTTIGAAATTDTAIQIPADAIVKAVSVRVTVAIPTAATFDVGIAGNTTKFGTGILVAANTTNKGTITPEKNASAIAVRITPNLTPAANTGRVRVTIYYEEVTAPTS
jgi:hypothetical protein